VSELFNVSWRTVLLECPLCGEELSGLSGDQIFFCSACRVGIDFFDHPAAVIPVRYSLIESTLPDRVLWLPVWFFSIETMIESEKPEKTVTASSPGSAWIFAFKIHKMHLFGNPHVEFSRLNPPISFDGTSQEVVGCQLRRHEAVQMLNPVVSAVVDAEQDITDLCVQLLIRTIELRAMPFLISDKTIENFQTGLSINRTSILLNLS
jgi:hypothetical protein